MLSNKAQWFVVPQGFKQLIGLTQLDLCSAAAHELGHLFGLDHVDRRDSVMRPKLDTGEIWISEGQPICDYDTDRLRARYGDILFYGA